MADRPGNSLRPVSHRRVPSQSTRLSRSAAKAAMSHRESSLVPAPRLSTRRARRLEPTTGRAARSFVGGLGLKVETGFIAFGSVGTGRSGASRRGYTIQTDKQGNLIRVRPTSSDSGAASGPATESADVTAAAPSSARNATAEKLGGNPAERSSESLSGFLAKVVDQLSVTAWLPGVVFVGNAAVLLELSSQQTLSFNKAVGNLAAMEWGGIVVGLFAITIAAVLLQAFEFEILRFFEGYHRSRGMSNWARRGIARHGARRASIDEQVKYRQKAAFTAAREKALAADGISEDDRAAWNALEKVIHDWKLTDEDRLALSRASALNWPSRSPAALLHDWDVAQLKLAEYPAEYRVLPTRLGNAMRAAEDEVNLADDEDLEGFIIRNYDRLPATVTAEHDAYRGRLEMYLGLIVTAAALAIVAAACLWHSTGPTASVVWRSVTPLGYVAVGFLCYRAAVASALGFGVALREAGAWVNRNPGEAVEQGTR